MSEPGPPPTLADLAREGADVWCWCMSCHHHATVPIATAIGRFGPATAFPRIGRSFRCTACGSRDIDVRPDWSARSPGQITRHT